MMDAGFQTVLRLWEQEASQKEIARRLRISPQKVCKILVTAGAIETEESKLQKQGLTVTQIAERLEKSEKAVIARIPYDKGIYNAEYPTRNALKIRKCREKKQAGNKKSP